MVADRPSILLAGYFPRSVDLEGVGSLLRGLATAMVGAGWSVRLLLPEGTSWTVAGADLHLVRTGAGRTRAYARAVRRLAAGTEAVLLIENNPALARLSRLDTGSEPTWLMFISPLNTLRVFREMGFCRQSILHAVGKSRLLARLHDWSAVRCLVASEYQAGQLRRLGVREVRVMPACGLSRQSPVPDRAAARRSLGWSADSSPVIGYLGHYSRAKGVDTLLEAFERLPADCRLAVAYSGKGRLMRAGRERLDRFRRAGRLREHGVVDAPVFLAACDVVALPYMTSSVFHPPQVMLESFAASTPVVTARVGGVAEVVESERVGLSVPPRDPAALAGAIGRLLGDPEAAGGMGRRARALFEERLCAEAFVAEFGALLAAGDRT
jgi:glycosyltransferase involved in cell wall biosynthesis